MSISMPGMGTGLDIQSMAKQMSKADLAPKSNQLTKNETAIDDEIAALGTLESALEGFYSSLDSFSDPESFGTLKVNMASDDSDFFTVDIDKEATANSYDIAVEQLASKDKWQMMTATSSKDVIFDPADKAETKDIKIQTAEMKDGENKFFTVTIKAGDTLKDVMNKINDSKDNPGINASIISGSTGASLTLTSNKSGTEHAITSIDISDGITGGNINNINPAANAMITIDGIKVESQSNKVEDILPGITLNLKKPTEDIEDKDGNKISHEAVNVDLSTDIDKMEASIKSIVKNYNTLREAVDSLTESEPAGPGETAARPPLAGDPLTNSLTKQIRNALITPIDGSIYTNLASLGIVSKPDGTLEIDSKALDKALEENTSDVVKLFVGDDTVLSRLMDVTESFIGTQESSNDDDDDDDDSYKLKKDGLIKDRLDGLKDDQRDIEDEWTTINTRAEDLYQRYFNEFNAMDLAVQQMNASMQNLTSLLA